MPSRMAPAYENAGGSESNYWIDYDYRYLRMMVEISTYNSNELDHEIAVITQKGKELFPNATVSAVGNIPQFTTMQQYLVKGQIRSFGISIVIVAVLLMIVFGSFSLFPSSMRLSVKMMNPAAVMKIFVKNLRIILPTSPTAKIATVCQMTSIESLSICMSTQRNANIEEQLKIVFRILQTSPQ